MTAPVLSLHRKLAQVMYEAERIPKNGTAPPAMGNFKFVQVGDAADAIRKSLAEKNVSMIPTAIEVMGESEHTTSQGKIMTTLTVRTTWTLTDGESGESIQIQSLGAGADTGDKAAPKAQSSAMKYALLMGFLLSTGDDPEQTDTSDRRRQTPAEVNAQERERLFLAGAEAQAEAAKALADDRADRDGLIGTAIAQGTQDFELRQGPDGFTLPFRVKNGRSSFIVLAEGKLAEALSVIRPTVEGQRVTVWGHWTDETIPAKGNKPEINYRVLHLERIETPDGMLPPVEDIGPEPPPDIELPFEEPVG